MSLIKNELLMDSGLITSVSVEAELSVILGLEATSGVTSCCINKERKRKSCVKNNALCKKLGSFKLLHYL